MEAWEQLLRPPSFRLGDWTVRPQEGVVENGRESNRPEPKVMAVLAYLVANRGRVVSKEEILRDAQGGYSLRSGIRRQTFVK